MKYHIVTFDNKRKKMALRQELENKSRNFEISEFSHQNKTMVGRSYWETVLNKDESHTSSSSNHECLECSRTFQRRTDLERHVNAVHRQLKPYPCQICGVAFAEHYNLTRHITAVHERPKHPCSACGFGFTHLYKLERHKRDCKFFSVPPKKRNSTSARPGA